MINGGMRNVVICHRGSLRKIHLVPPPSQEKGDLDREDTDDDSFQNSSLMLPHHTIYTISISTKILGIESSDMDDSTSTTFCNFDEEHDYDQGASVIPNYELFFEREHFEFISNLFAILDTKSRGFVDKDCVRDFVLLRCPAFRRRDQFSEKIQSSRSQPSKTRSTFDEVWRAVILCSKDYIPDSVDAAFIGIEGWMVFCRFIVLVQYEEAKRKFCARYSQETMQRKGNAEGVVLVNVSPPDPPVPITIQELIKYDDVMGKAANGCAVSLPQLDLDHCNVSAHDNRHESEANIFMRNSPSQKIGSVKVSVFGSGSSSSKAPNLMSSNAMDSLEFVIEVFPVRPKGNNPNGSEDLSSSIIVRRTFTDMEWLHNTFVLHKKVGGTLCGRILPPFPTRVGETKSEYDQQGNCQKNNSGMVAMAVANAGVGMISSAAKSARSFWGSYYASSTTADSPSTTANGSLQRHSNTRRLLNSNRDCSSSESRYQNSLSKARQLERYLNYLVEHAALSTSFPLNAILKASQSGLEAAKNLLQNNNKYTIGKNQRSELEDIENSSSFLNTFFSNNSSFKYRIESLSWVRSAAQAALALKLDGILETTGLQSASAKLQHASLPQFMPRSQSISMESDSGNEERSPSEGLHPIQRNHSGEMNSEFEKRVINVKSGLDLEVIDGYDMLPAPFPIAERSALCAGSISPVYTKNTSEEGDAIDDRYGFIYDDDEVDDDERLGDLYMNRDIERLRDVIRSVDDNLRKCLESISMVGDAMQERTALHLSILKGINSWAEKCGGFIAERYLLAGVAELECVSEVSGHGISNFSCDLSWNTSLAHSAVSAVEELCDSVNVSRTAARAKRTAEKAAKTLQNRFNSDIYSSKEEEDIAKKHVSELQNHIIYSTVLEHEAMVAKGRVAKALANDVKYWNVHRKRELYHACLATAKSQHIATGKSIEAWSQLKDGLLNLFSVPMIVENRVIQNTLPQSSKLKADVEYFSPSSDNNIEDGYLHLDALNERNISQEKNEQYTDQASCIIHTGDLEDLYTSSDIMKPTTTHNDDFMNTGETSIKSPVEDNHTEITSPEMNTDKSDEKILGCQENEVISKETESAIQGIDSLTDTSYPNPHDYNFDLKYEISHRTINASLVSSDLLGTEACDQMTDSMQSLVDGLMTWGGQYDSDEDLSLPQGMGASLVLEERNRDLA